MPGRRLRFAGVVAALAILGGVAAWWAFRGAAGAGPEADGLSSSASGEPGTAPLGPISPTALAASGVHVRPLAVGSAQIEGTVWRGTKPSAARVLAYVATPTPGDEPAVARADAGDEGRFVIPRLPVGSYELIAEDAEGRRGGALVEVALPGQRVGCELRLREGTEILRGRVIDVGGRPWRGRVTVLAHTPDLTLPSREHPSVETDAEGRFVLGRLERGRAAPHGWDSTGLEWTALELDVPAPREIVIDLGAGAREATGVVLDAVTSRPVAGATLVTRAGRANGYDAVVRRTVTGADGRFRLAIPVGAEAVIASAAGYAPAWLDARRATPNLTLRLVRPGRIAGRVLHEPGGGGVAEVAVVAQRLHVRDVPYDALRTSLRTSTTGGGAYALDDVPPGDYLLSALGSGVCTPEVGLVDVEDSSLFRVHVEPDRTATLDLRAPAAGSVQGVVLDDEGAPVAGAVVSWAEVEDGVFEGGHDRRVPSGSDGRFRFDAVVPGALRLEASAAGFVASDATPEAPRVRGGETVQVTLRVHGARYALVTVVDPDGKPIPGAWVSGWRHAVTGADGTARFPWRRNEPLRVYVSAPGFAERSEVIPDDGSPVPELRITLPRGLVLSGRVVGSRGQPLPGAQVQGDGPTGRLSAVADGEGRFRVWAAVEGPWELVARAEGAGWGEPEETTTRAPDEAITVVAVERTPAGFPLRVVGPDGAPVPHVRLLTDPEERPRYEETIPGEGARVDVGARSVVLEVFDARDDAGLPLPLAALRSTRIPAGRTEPFELRLAPERVIEGRVLDASGRGLPGVRLEAVARVRDENDDERQHAPVHAGAFTDGEGRFHLGGLWAGPYRVIVARGEGFSVPEPVLVDAPATGVRIDLRPSVTVTVKVVDADGRPVPGSHVVARRADDPSGAFATSGETDAEGAARLERLDPTLRYAVVIAPPTTFLRGRSTSLPDWSPADGTVPLPRAHELSGWIRDEDGAAIPYAQLFLSKEGRRVQTASAGANGAFTIGQLVPGTYDLEATPPGERDQFPTSSGRTTTPSGRLDEVVTVPGKPLRIRMDDYDYGNGGPVVSVGVIDGTKLGPWRHEVLYRTKEAVFPCLDPAHEYVVFVPVGPDGNGAFLGPVRPRSEVYALRATPGRTVTGRVLLPSADDAVTLVVAGSAGTLHLPDGRRLALAPGRGAPTWAGPVAANGTFRIPGLPEGSFRVTVEARVAGATVRASAWEKGEPLEIPLGGR